MFERRNQAPSCPGVRKLQPGNSRKQYRSSSSTPFDSRIALNSARERRCPVLRRYTQPQNNTQQEERQFLTIAPTRAPCARGKCEAPRSLRRQRGPAWRVQVARKVEDAQEEKGLSLSPQRQREGPWRMRGVRKDFDAYFGTREIDPLSPQKTARARLASSGGAKG